MVNFYEKQIDVLDNMLEEVTQKYNALNKSKESNYFRERFVEKQNLINELKHDLNVNNFLLTRDLAHNQGKMSDVYVNENKHIEEHVVSFEKEVNELSKDFKNYILDKI
jgi:Zn-dependent oligopeptidase